MGAVSGNVVVTTGATLALQGTSLNPINVGIKTLTVTGTGLGDQGVVDNISGSNSWAGTITQNAATSTV